MVDVGRPQLVEGRLSCPRCSQAAQHQSALLRTAEFKGTAVINNRSHFVERFFYRCNSVP
jgi:hypothetical protein